MVEKQDAGNDQSSRRDADLRAEQGVSVERAHEPAQKAPATGSVDALACGALLAIAGPVIVTKRLAVLAGASVLAVLVCHFFQSLWIFSVALPSFAILISGAANGFGGMFGRILSQPLLQYIGRISYGIYVIHFPITTVGASLSHWFPQSFRNTLVSAACAIVTLGLAMLSWHFIESPINRRRSAIVAAVFKPKPKVKLERVDA